MSESPQSGPFRGILVRAALLAVAAVALAGGGAALLLARSGNPWLGLAFAAALAVAAGVATRLSLRRGLAPLEAALAVLHRLGQGDVGARVDPAVR